MLIENASQTGVYKYLSKAISRKRESGELVSDVVTSGPVDAQQPKKVPQMVMVPVPSGAVTRLADALEKVAKKQHRRQVCVCVCVLACMHVCMYVCTCVDVHSTNECTNLPMYIHTYIHTYIRTYIHAYVQYCVLQYCTVFVSIRRFVSCTPSQRSFLILTCMRTWQPTPRPTTRATSAGDSRWWSMKESARLRT